MRDINKLYLLINPNKNKLNQTLVWKKICIFILSVMSCFAVNSYAEADVSQKQEIKALYIPLADHYAAVVAFERYREQMEYADFKIEKMKSWDLLRAYFQSGEVDMAFVMSPLAMDMFNESPHFKWIGLMHRDGNALAINSLMNEQVGLAKERSQRKPDSKVAQALKNLSSDMNRSVEVGMPHLLATHTVVLYRYLKEHGLTLSLIPNTDAEVLAITVPPPKAPAFIKSKSNRAEGAAFEQSLPWADVVETGNFGKVAWYSKDVMPWKHGHVECIVLATNNAIKEKNQAVDEVMKYIHQAGKDIEEARAKGGKELDTIITMIRKHIPAHTRAAIIASLDPHLRVINYEHLNVDKAGLKQIMDFAVEGGILKREVDIDSFADTQFNQ